MSTVAVLGGGIAGLTAAAVLKDQGVSVSVFEASDRAGGVIRSVRHGGFLADLGPNSMLAPPPGVMELLATGELSRERVETSPIARRRFVVRDGRPQPVPTSPQALFGTSLFSANAKWRLVTDAFRSSRPPAGEESLAALVRRRLGQEVVDYGLNPMVAGVYAGDPERLSAAHAMPTLGSLEARYGSLVGGAIKAMKARRREAANEPEGRLFSFRQGMETLPRTLADLLGPDLHLSSRVVALAPSGTGWTVTLEGPFGPRRREADAVICTLPAHALSRIAFGGEGDGAWQRLDRVAYSPVAVVVTGHRREDVTHPLDGFGVLVPAAERLQTLGTLFSSTLFPERAPDGCVTLTTFVGGARDPELAVAPESELAAAVEADHRALLGVQGAPVLRIVGRHPRGIPQYNLGHGEHQAALDEVEQRNPGLFFAGSHRNGVAVGDVMTSGLLAAEAAVQVAPAPVGMAG